MPLAAQAAVSTGEPAALLVFPLITVDGASGIDSLIQLTTADGTAVAARCLYENPSASPSLTPFTIRLSANQPVAWRASTGLDAVPGDGGAVPPLGSGPFTGVLRCLAADASGTPADRNVLVGSVTIERFSTAATVTVDSARYSATGIDALPGAVNGDDQLVLGGPAAEYTACPASIVLTSFFDGAVLDLGADGTAQREVSTTLAVVPCAHTPGGSAGAVLTFAVTDELGVTLTTSRGLQKQLVMPLSRLDTSTPSRSIFSIGARTAPTGLIRITPSGGGVLAVAVQTHADPEDAARAYSAAASPQLAGELATQDVVDLSVPAPACVGDCDGDGTVAINELILGVNIALGNQQLSVCPAFDANQNGSVAINELITAVNNALAGC